MEAEEAVLEVYSLCAFLSCIPDALGCLSAQARRKARWAREAEAKEREERRALNIQNAIELKRRDDLAVDAHVHCFKVIFVYCNFLDHNVSVWIPLFWLLELN